MGALVVLAPSTQEWIDCFNQLLGRHGHATLGPLPHLILKTANRFLSRIRIQRTRTRIATDLTHRKSKSLPALDLVAEELEAMLNVDDPRLLRMQLHSQLSQDSQGDGHCRSRLCRRLAGNHPVVRVPRQLISLASHLPIVGDEAGYTAGSSGHAPYTKGNFQFERTVVGWRERYTLLDLRRK